MDVDDLMFLSLAKNSTQFVLSIHFSIIFRLDWLLLIIASNPPILFTHLRELSASSMQSIEGVLMVLPLKIFSWKFPLFVNLNNLGIGQVGVYSSSLWIALGDKTRIPCCASPPRTFCHENVVTSSLFHEISIANTADVASHKVSPSLSPLIQSPFGTLTPAVVPFQVKITSLLKSTLLISGK